MPRKDGLDALRLKCEFHDTTLPRTYTMTGGSFAEMLAAVKKLPVRQPERSSGEFFWVLDEQGIAALQKAGYTLIPDAQATQQREKSQSGGGKQHAPSLSQAQGHKGAGNQARDERAATNALLQEYGFRWRRHENDEEDIDLLGMPPYEWILHSTSAASETSYGTAVTVREAMEAIATKGESRAADWLVHHPKPVPPEEHPIQITRGGVPYTRGEQVMAEPHGLVVVERPNKQWIPEDGWSFGLLAEQGWLFQAECRKATSQELRAYEAEQERLQTEANRQAHQAEVERWHAWQQEHLDGLVCTTLSVPTPPRGFHKEYMEHWLPTGVHFDAGWHDTGTTYYRFELEGQTIFIEEYGNASRSWLPSTLAEKYYRAWWEQGGYLKADRTPALSRGHLALAILERACHGFTTFGADIDQWVFEHIGEQVLVDLVRAGALIEDEHGHYALASKWYRLPIRAKNFVDVRPGTGRMYDYHDGYGQYHLTRGSNQDEVAWQREQRLSGWVPLGNEASGNWPTEEDRAYTRAYSEQIARGFTEIFGE